MSQKRVQIRVTGRVQGVFFRANAKEQAEKLDLRGIVWNTPDGAVEIVAEGEDTSLTRLIEWCHVGPSGAGVMTVTTGYEEPTGEFETFRIKY